MSESTEIPPQPNVGKQVKDLSDSIEALVYEEKIVEARAKLKDLEVLFEKYEDILTLSDFMVFEELKEKLYEDKEEDVVLQSSKSFGTQAEVTKLPTADGQDFWPPTQVTNAKLEINVFGESINSLHKRLDRDFDPDKDGDEDLLNNIGNDLITITSTAVQLSNAVAVLKEVRENLKYEFGLNAIQKSLRQRELKEISKSFDEKNEKYVAMQELLWEKRLFFDHPKLLELRKEMLSAMEQTFAGDHRAHFQTLSKQEEDLNELYSEATTVVRQLVAESPSAVQNSRDLFIRKHLLNPAKNKLDLKREETFSFWAMPSGGNLVPSRHNLELIHAEFGTEFGRIRDELIIVDNLHSLSDDSFSASDKVDHLQKLLRSAQATIDHFNFPTKYGDFLEANYWAEVRNRIDKLATLVEKRKTSQFIRGKLEAMASLSYQVNNDMDQIQDAYSPLYSVLDSTQQEGSLSLEVVKSLRSEVVASEFMHRAKAYLSLMTQQEVANPSNFSETALKSLDDKLKKRMSTLVDEASNLSYSGTGRLREMFDSLSSDLTTRKLLQFCWMTSEGKVHAPVDGVRTFPIVTEETFPLSGAIVENFINETMEIPELGVVENQVIANRPVRLKSWTDYDEEQEMVLKETAAGKIMRLIDRVYSGEIKEAKTTSGELIGTTNINRTHSDLINFIYDQELIAVEKERKRALQAGETPGFIEPRFNKHFIMRVFRAHMMLTLNHAYLAKTSPQVADNIYYLFHWLEYALKYAEQGVNKFNPLVTLLLFHYRGSNPLNMVYGDNTDKVVAKIRSSLHEKGLWEDSLELKEENKFSAYRFLGNGSPLFGIDNVGHGSTIADDTTPKPRTNHPIFSPPLRNWAITDSDFGLGTTGEPLRYPPSLDENDGRIITFADVTDVEGNILYELLPLKKIGNEMLGYYSHMGSNGINFLKHILKAPEAEFLQTMENPDKVAGLKNEEKYVVNTLPIVGLRQNYIDHSTYHEVMEKIVVVLIYAKCLIETDLGKKKIWGYNHVRDYLRGMAQKGVISESSEQAIYVAVKAGKGYSISLMQGLRRLQDQVEKRLQFT